mmetsp:Transcript_107480/g.291378  ORF Transcript_107480/g.291378 Transcript_107480/m.291378 type:complete len:163 (+) Transcript_107480:99-587(+)
MRKAGGRGTAPRRARAEGQKSEAREADASGASKGQSGPRSVGPRGAWILLGGLHATSSYRQRRIAETAPTASHAPRCAQCSPRPPEALPPRAPAAPQKSTPSCRRACSPSPSGLCRNFRAPGLARPPVDARDALEHSVPPQPEHASADPEHQDPAGLQKGVP